MKPAHYGADMARTAPLDRRITLSAGTFRTLQWDGGGDRPTVFLHGLSALAEAWTDTVAAFGDDRPRCIALDQRGHGHSPRTPGAYAVRDYVRDLLELVDQLGAPVDVVGHSMGARVAMVAAARHPDRVASVVIVDIGPEAWKANIAATAGLFGRLPESFPGREEAMALGLAMGRGPAAAERFVEERLRVEPDGTYVWRASADALIETVTTQRARNYWQDWEQVSIPALLVRGGTSRELRPRIVDEMRRRNPSVAFRELDGVGHNVPLLAPVELAATITAFRAT